MSQFNPNTTFYNASLPDPYRYAIGALKLNHPALLTAPSSMPVDRFSQQMASPITPSGLDTILPAEPSVGFQPLNPAQIVRLMRHPKRTGEWFNYLRIGNDPSTLRERLAMMATIHQKLDKTGKIQLENLLKNGILTNTDGDDTHSTLYYLYAIATTKRAEGLSGKNTLQEVVATLDNPYRISQKFNRLMPDTAQKMLMAEAQSPRIDPRKPVSADNFATYSNTCQAASIMFVMAQTQPKELARMAYGLTSPRLATREKVRLDQLADTPLEAFQRLKKAGIAYKVTGPNEVTVALKLPQTAYQRMVDDAKLPDKRNGVDAALQSAFVNLVSRNTYDGLSDRSWDTDSALVTIENTDSLPPLAKEQLKAIINAGMPMQATQRQALNLIQQLPMIDPHDRQALIDGLFLEASGINEDQISLARSILQDKGNVESVTYMASGAIANSNNSSPYLFGYNRDFDRISQDLLTALNAGHYPIIGTVPTDSSGAILNGHITTITGAFVDKTGALQFVIADSDDDINHHVIRAARELIPQIHHVSFPKEQAKQILKEMQTLGNHYLTPGPAEASRYQVISMAPPAAPTDSTVTRTA
ncbi:MAG: hypothetical protein VKK59_07695 [Vampirovibrionales bacterium]|nr:hypothetical protein [Vampirovibrionales bacterium]